MAKIASEANTLLSAARERGARAIGGVAIPSGLDQLAIYAGLIGSALELGKLIQTEERDKKVIDNHYNIEMNWIGAAFKEVEAAMMADFNRDESFKEKTFEMMRLLVAAGQFEIANQLHERMVSSFQRPALESIIAHQNALTKESGSYIGLK